LTDALSVADVVVALTEIGLNLVGFSSSVEGVVPVEGDGVSILDGVESGDRGRSSGKSNSRLVVILCRVRASASIVKGSNLNLEVVTGLNVVLGEVLLGQSARVSVVQARLVEDSRAVSHRSDVALRKSNPVVLSLVLELVVRDSSHLNFILTDGRASRGGFGPAEADTASLEIDLGLRSSRRSKSDDGDGDNVRADSSTSLTISSRDLDSVELGIGINLSGVRSLVAGLEVVDLVQNISLSVLVSVGVNIDLVSSASLLLPADSELTVSLNLTDGSSKKRSDGSSSGGESSSGSNSLGSLTNRRDSETSDLDDVTKVVVLLVEVVEAKVDSLGSGRAGVSVLVLVLVSESVVNASTVRYLSPGALAVSLTVLNSVRGDSRAAGINRGSPVHSYGAATNVNSDIDSSRSTRHGSADLVGGRSRALSNSGDSEASLNSGVNLLSDLVLDVALSSIVSSVGVEGAPVVAVELVLVSTGPFNQVAGVRRNISSRPGEGVALDRVEERLSGNSSRKSSVSS